MSDQAGTRTSWMNKSLWALVGSSAFLLLPAAPALAEAPAVPAAQGAAAEQPAVAVIFAGFSRRADKGASIFLRMTGEVPVALDRAGRRLTYRLSGAKLGVPNSGNPLPTEHFGPPVSHVALVPSTTGVDLIIDLSADPDGEAPTPRIVSSGGLSTLHVDLPPAR
ncbi:MAG TPA: hypothetical protein VJU61_12565 [Polyangiaceae bacterium]|nr:hypothetical protein [Polyangiaceae bacterium]